jgi:hypothetical protein
MRPELSYRSFGRRLVSRRSFGRRLVSRRSFSRLGLAVLPLILACGGPLAKIEAVRDGLADDDLVAVRSATSSYPVCKEPFTVLPEKGCFQDIANAFGSKNGFNTAPPDQAAAATVALVLVREKRGDWFAGADTWLQAMRGGKGPGPDALRLATARQMAAAVPDVRKKADDENTALGLMKAVGEAVPGSCATYTAVGSGLDPASLPIEMMPDHSPCVQKDLARKDGPGGTYGRGVFRAAEGAVALWKDEARALREGLALMNGKPRATVEANLKKIEDATPEIALKKVPRGDEWLGSMQDTHGDAGVPFVDAGPPPKAPPRKL